MYGGNPDIWTKALEDYHNKLGKRVLSNQKETEEKEDKEKKEEEETKENEEKLPEPKTAESKFFFGKPKEWDGHI